MKSLYLECASGISGDMAVAALLDAGADENAVRRALESVPAGGFRFEISRVKKSGIDCCDFNVMLDKEHENHDHDMEYLFGHESDHVHPHEHAEHRHGHDHSHGEHHAHEHHEHHHEHRGLAEIARIIDGTDMTDGAKSLAHKIFGILADAEAKAHGIPRDEVHFHEVGALDSIADVIALAVCFESLGVGRVYVPRLFEGSGTIRCQHGIIPVPVPAVANIAAEYSLCLSISDAHGEFVTPTGAAFVAAVKTHSKLPETFTVRKIGLGAGKREYERPSILRAFIIEEDEKSAAAKIVKLETTIDDSTGESLGLLLELLFEAGAHDANFIPCFMKKNRPAYLLTVIAEQERVPALERIIFQNSTTIGIRKCSMERSVLARKIVSVRTPWGDADVKTVDALGVRKAYPEYESVRKICKEQGLAFDFVYREIARIAEANCQD
ncbi:MAG: nickel pincer cofactor biosynthesis protein LarC [Treponema sp.]|nr:nickel pincer cofactor biosynthesis protein LarC [Treponema sp.]